MKRLSGVGEATVDAPPGRALELLSAVERYPGWAGELVPRAEVLERDTVGQPARARATLRIALGPLNRDFQLDFDVRVSQEGRVRLTRAPHEPGDRERFEVDWRVEDGPPARIQVKLEAELDIPRFLPVPLEQLSQSVAQGLVDAAKAELEGSSPNASASSS